jgi:hypothetical protein
MVQKSYLIKDTDELTMTGKQLREFKEIVIAETKAGKY